MVLRSLIRTMGTHNELVAPPVARAAPSTAVCDAEPGVAAAATAEAPLR